METELFISSETAEHYGEITKEFSVWAETQGIQKLLIVAPEDVAFGKDPQNMPERQQNIT